MDSIFRQQQEIHFYDCDPQRRLKMSAACKLIADIGDAHYAARGMSHEWLWEHGFVFLVAKVSIQFNRLPGPREQLTLETWERDLKGASFLRDGCIKDAAGAEIIAASSAWMLVNAETWQVRRPSEFPYAQPTGMAANCPECRRLKLAEGTPAGERLVRYSDLDANGHVYNAVYADIAVDALPEEFQRREIAAMQINFVHQAVPGDRITLICRILNTNTVIIKGTVGDHDCFLCEFEFRPE